MECIVYVFNGNVYIMFIHNKMQQWLIYLFITLKTLYNIDLYNKFMCDLFIMHNYYAGLVP